MNATQIVPGVQRKLKNYTGFRMTLNNILTMAYRGLVEIRRSPQQLSDVTIQPILFTLMFTYLFGGAIAGNVHNYLPLVIPGILVMTVISAGMATGVQLCEDIEKGVFNRFRILPIARIAPLAGALLADVIRYGIATILTFVMGYILGYRGGGGFGGLLAGGFVVIVFSWCVSWIFAFIGVIARSTTTVQGISFVIIFPLLFLSNAFVPTNTLPGWLQTFVKINPVTHLVGAIRQLCNQGTVGHDFWLSLIGAAVIVLVFVPLTLRAYMRKA